MLDSCIANLKVGDEVLVIGVSSYRDMEAVRLPVVAIIYYENEPPMVLLAPNPGNPKGPVSWHTSMFPDYLGPAMNCCPLHPNFGNRALKIFKKNATSLYS